MIRTWTACTNPRESYGSREIAPCKKGTYIRVGTELLEQADRGLKTRKSDLQPWTCCKIWPAQIDSTLKASIQMFLEESQVLRSAGRTGTRDICPTSQKTSCAP